MSVGVLSHDGDIVLPRTMHAAPEAFLQAVAPARAGLGVAVEGLCTWDGLADLGAAQGMPFALGHALSMRAIHGGKAKHDTSDAPKRAAWLRGGMRPQASGDPARRRATRDLLRRRTHLMRTRSARLAHVHTPTSQDHLPALGTKIAAKANREGVAERFRAPAVHKALAVDLARISHEDARLNDLERSLRHTAQHHEAQPLAR
jgi:hypothetical protein